MKSDLSRLVRAACFVTFLATIAATIALAQSTQPAQSPQAQQTADAHAVPVMDGSIGSCSADFTIVDADNKPVYAAKVKVHIAYGFMYARKLDLEQGTNIDGRARFTGLPDRVKHGLYFNATEGDRSGVAFDDPSSTCKAQFTITIRKQS
jgi:hypothetical protein